MFNLQVAKEDVKNGLYTIADGEKIGDYELVILCSHGDIIISLFDGKNIATSTVTEGRFLSLSQEEFDRLMGEILAYNLIAIEEDDDECCYFYDEDEDVFICEGCDGKYTTEEDAWNCCKD